jgi:hypothetical protein
VSWPALWSDVRREVPGRTCPRWFVLATLALGALFALVYQLGVPLRSTYGARINVDEPFYLMTTVSLLQDGDLDLRNDFALRRYTAFFDPVEMWSQSAPTADGRLLSPHNVGLSLLLMPAYAISGLDGVKAFLAVLGGATVALTALVVQRATGLERSALVASALLGSTAPLFVYATQIYPELPAALFLLGCVWLVLAPRPGWTIALGLSLGISALAWLGFKYSLVGAVVAAMGLVRLSGGARLVFLTALGLSGALYVGFHLATYGALTPYSVNRLYAGDGFVELVGQHLAIWDRLYRFLGLWLDAEFGLIRWAPLLLLTVPALLPLLARRGPTRWTWSLLLATQLLIAVFLSVTMRGWWFPGRMLIVVLPLMALPLSEALAWAGRRPVFAALTAGLSVYSMAITIGLVRATAAGEVALAVDPFALAWPPFHDLAAVFPLYTAYSASTWLLSGAWLVGLGLLLVAPWVVMPRGRTVRADGAAIVATR